MKLHRAQSTLRICVALLALTLLPASLRAEVIERVLAVVAGDLILQSDVDAARELKLMRIAPAAADPAGAVLSQLIDRALILAEVERFPPPEPDAASVDKALAVIRNRFPSPAAYGAMLARLGLEERHLRETIRQDLRIAAYLAQRFTAPSPSADELGRYYRDHPDEFTVGGVLQPFDTVRAGVAAAVNRERGAAIVQDWLAGLRRRADIRNLYVPPAR